MRKKGASQKNIPVLMKPKITSKVAQVVDDEGASFFEAPLGCSDWEWKPQEDDSFAAPQYIRIRPDLHIFRKCQ